MDDTYYSFVEEHWESIFSFYAICKERRPIMLFDIQEQRIYAYEYYGFESELNPGNQTMLEEQYEEASELDSFVVFVRDNDERRLVSYVVGSDCPAPKPKKKRRKRER